MEKYIFTYIKYVAVYLLSTEVNILLLRNYTGICVHVRMYVAALIYTWLCM